VGILSNHRNSRSSLVRITFSRESPFDEWEADELAGASVEEPKDGYNRSEHDWVWEFATNASSDAFFDREEVEGDPPASSVVVTGRVAGYWSSGIDCGDEYDEEFERESFGIVERFDWRELAEQALEECGRRYNAVLEFLKSPRAEVDLIGLALKFELAGMVQRQERVSSCRVKEGGEG